MACGLGGEYDARARFRVRPVVVVMEQNTKLSADVWQRRRVNSPLCASKLDGTSERCSRRTQPVSRASITLDKARIEHQRTILKKTWEATKASADNSNTSVPRLAQMTLPDDLFLEISDKGHGMTREDLATKFLVAGRRRRGREHDDLRSVGGRLLMGRKGLGKLAGFGVAKVVSVTTRAKGEKHATKITLKYDDLIDVSDTHEIPIEEQRLDDGGGIADHGTKIVLSGLLYEPMGTRLTTIEHRAADHFAQIAPSEFQIILNGKTVSPTPRSLVYAYPEPTKDVKEVVQRSYKVEDGRLFHYQYRIRFVGFVMTAHRSTSTRAYFTAASTRVRRRVRVASTTPARAALPHPTVGSAHPPLVPRRATTPAHGLPPTIESP